MGKLSIDVVDPDDDYTGISIQVKTDRYAGCVFIYAPLDKLNEVANDLRGFPRNREDEQLVHFGTRDPRYAGGYCSLRFYLLDGSGRFAVDVILEDDEWHSESKLTTTLKAAVASDCDHFVSELQQIGLARCGKATLAFCE